MKYIKNKLIIFILLAIFPINAFAMTIQVENKDSNVQEGDIAIFDVYLNSEDEINSVEGVLRIEGDYTLKTITTAGSVFDMWPNKPSFNDQKISFAGGSASSVFGNHLKLFSIVAKVNSSKGIIFSSDQTDAFLNDGIGTKVSIDSFKKEIILPKQTRESIDKFEEVVLHDQEPPLDFTISIGRDENSYDGKYFASFNTTDKDSGIERYEVIENDIKTPILTGTTYVLQDQTLKGSLIVRAIDKAGNVSVSEVKVKDVVSDDGDINWFSLTIVLLILFVLFLLSKKIKIKNVRI
ncbi:MAG: hypothetical protein RLZZ517_594 [Candidatus Parcubacteria bacterium]|jgi:hypothetical protein